MRSTIPVADACETPSDSASVRIGIEPSAWRTLITWRWIRLSGPECQRRM